MKTNQIMFMLLCFLCLSNAKAQTLKANSFYHKYERSEDITKFSIPGWIIDIGVAIAKNSVEDEDELAALKLAKKIQKLRFIVMEGENEVTAKEYQKLKNSFLKSDFEPLISIRDEGTNLNILLKEKKGMLKHFVILIAEEEEFIFLNMKTKIKIEDINKVMQLLKDDFNIDVLPNEKDDDTPLIRA